MADPRKAASFSLPPGCRFHPSEDQLLRYYLANKNTDSHSDGSHLYGYDLIKELDLYEYEPYELPDVACFAYGYGGRRRHWYCYTVRVVKERMGRRRAKGGYWRRRGRGKEVVGHTGVVGIRTSFGFYLGNSPKSAVGTDWVMHEYSLVDQPKDSFVVCRVFVKSHGGNSISENVLSSCAEESVSAVRHIGIQRDGIITSDIVKSKVHDDNSVDKNDVPSYPLRPVSKLDDRVTTGPDYVSSFKFPSGIQPSQSVRLSELTSGGAMFADVVAAQQLLSIPEDDFIELDDLVTPIVRH